VEIQHLHFSAIINQLAMIVRIVLRCNSITSILRETRAKLVKLLLNFLFTLVPVKNLDQLQ